MAKHERPELTPDRNVEAGVKDTFPASDPVAATTAQGSRAVPPEQMMGSADECAAPGADCVPVETRFPDREAAKLALETLVREGPLERRHAEIRPGEGGVVLHFLAAPKDAERLRALAGKHGTSPAPG